MRKKMRSFSEATSVTIREEDYAKRLERVVSTGPVLDLGEVVAKRPCATARRGGGGSGKVFAMHICTLPRHNQQCLVHARREGLFPQLNRSYTAWGGFFGGFLQARAELPRIRVIRRCKEVEKYRGGGGGFFELV